MAKPLDTDYLHLSTRLKAMEKNMLSREKLTRLITARSDEDALKLLTENGWKSFKTNDSAALEQEISRQRKETFDLIYRYVPDARVIDIFRLKYDYHNLKSLIKANALGISADHLLSDAGTIEPAKIKAMINDKDYSRMPKLMANAAQEAADLLSRTGDPQLSDLLLDKALTEQMTAAAAETESDFLIGYIKLSSDLSNLRVLARAALSKKGFDYLQRAIFEGGNISCRQVREVTADVIRQLFGHGATAAAAEVAATAISSKTGLAMLDMECDNAQIEYLRASRLIPFGEAPVISYLLAFEAQLVAVRTVISGRAAGMSEEKITERLRMSYV